jgi:hypothetical protein
MIDYSTFKLLHRHGNEWAEVPAKRPVDSSDIDPEREWVADGVVYECPCGDSFIVAPDHETETLTARQEE